MDHSPMPGCYDRLEAFRARIVLWVGHSLRRTLQSTRNSSKLLSQLVKSQSPLLISSCPRHIFVIVHALDPVSSSRNHRDNNIIAILTASLATEIHPRPYHKRPLGFVFRFYSYIHNRHISMKLALFPELERRTTNPSSSTVKSCWTCTS